MRYANVNEMARAVLSRDAVKFDNNVRDNDQEAIPFWYPFIPSPYQDTDHLNGGLGLLGFLVDPGEVKDIPVLFDRDSAYRYINTKFSLRQCVVNTPNAVAIGVDTVTVTAGSPTVVSAGAAFVAADIGRKLGWIDDNNQYQTGLITAVPAGNATLSANALTSAAAGTQYNFSSPGLVSLTAGSNQVTGDANATFLTDYGLAGAPGGTFSYIDDNGLERCARILSVQADNAMTLYDPAVYAATTQPHSPVKWVWYSTLPIAAPSPTVPMPGFHYRYTPLERFIEAKLNIPSLAHLDFYGDNLYQSATGLTERRLPINNLQGVDDGNPMLRSPDALVPNEGTIVIQVTNTHTQPIYVNGACFGYKITSESDVGE